MSLNDEVFAVAYNGMTREEVEELKALVVRVGVRPILGIVQSTCQFKAGDLAAEDPSAARRWHELDQCVNAALQEAFRIEGAPKYPSVKRR